MLRLLVVGIVLARSAAACNLQGVDSGECVEPEDFQLFMPFCSGAVRYRACLPRFQELWPDHNVLTKDQWVESNFQAIVERRKQIETNKTLIKSGVNENGIPGDIEERFTDNPDCENAYKNYFCWLNFPRCDDEDRSLILCRSVCENFFKACKYPKDMWRCYNPAYYGGKEAETSADVNALGQAVFYRAQFPGQPFRDNRFDGDGDPIRVCTPSLANDAVAPRAGPGLLLATLGAAVALALGATGKRWAARCGCAR